MSATKTSWRFSAPSNIALIKYMGKTVESGNHPTNASLSYTLSHLRTHLELELLPKGHADRWEPLKGAGLAPIELSAKGEARFLRHLAFLKSVWKVNESFVVRSANDFPADCGLASSASSFAALTLTAANAFSEITSTPLPEAEKLAALSRQGSGSSCRSFFAPWSLWEAERASACVLPQHNLLHQTVVVEDAKKAVSSSEAHLRVASSLLFKGRPERAETRLKELISALKQDQWTRAMEICWAEFWDMHALFETSQPAFGYMTPGSHEVLSYVRENFWKTDRGPIVTMDAGANIHLLYRPEAGDLTKEIERKFSARYRVITGGTR